MTKYILGILGSLSLLMSLLVIGLEIFAPDYFITVNGTPLTLNLEPWLLQFAIALILLGLSSVLGKLDEILKSQQAHSG